MAKSNQIVIVDEHDNILYTKSEDDFTTGEINRAVALWIKNPKGEVLIATRSGKEHSSTRGKYCLPVMGSVEPGEDYVDTILREAYEELGIRFVSEQLSLDRKILLERTGKDNFCMCQFFIHTTNLDIEQLTPDPEEIAKLEWMTQHEARDLFMNHRDKCMNLVTQWYIKTNGANLEWHIPPSFYRTVAKALIVKDEKILLIYEKDRDIWELPGGLLEDLESPTEAIVREVKEEMGLTVSEVKPHPTYVWRYDRQSKHGFDVLRTLVLAYHSSVQSYDFTPSTECSEFKFFSKKELDDLNINDQITPLRMHFDMRDF